jgi:hypothetical protein
VLARALSSNSEGDLKNTSFSNQSSIDHSSSSWPQLQKSQWEDLNLWDDEGASWSERHPTMKLNAGEEKRQNIIYELFKTEKNHFQVLVFFQQIYHVGLRHHGILNERETNELIPDVLDALIGFHLTFLRRIRERVIAGPIVSTISDIVYEEFKNGANRNAAIHAYTTFCLAQNESDKKYAELMAKNVKFKAFCEVTN